MQVAVTGSRGFIGTALVDSLRRDGHTVIPVVRGDAPPGAVAWDPKGGTIDAAGLEGVDAVVHLAGAGIGDGRWSAKRKAQIHDSRSVGTRVLAEALATLEEPPPVLVSGSAIGYYGDRGDEVLTEDDEPGDDFLAQVCVDWEAATQPAADAGIRVVHARTGIVLGDGGALAKQLLLFRLGLGGQAGDGKQWLSWISLTDEVRALRFLIEAPEIHGPVNLTAPNAVTNRAYTRALGDALRRPTVLRIPGLVRHVPFGIGGLLDSLLFTSARVRPAVLAEHRFLFHHAYLPSAFEAAIGDP